MTIEEKRKAIEGYCNTQMCSQCPLYKINTSPKNCYEVLNDSAINRFYEILFDRESEETKEQNVPAEPKITLRDLLDIMVVSLVISEKHFDNVLVILKTDEYTPETYTSILAPEFLDREVYRMKNQDNNILVALKEVE